MRVSLHVCFVLFQTVFPVGVAWGKVEFGEFTDIHASGSINPCVFVLPGNHLQEKLQKICCTDSGGNREEEKKEEGHGFELQKAILNGGFQVDHGIFFDLSTPMS